MDLTGIIALEHARARASVSFVKHYLDKFIPGDVEWEAVYQLHEDAVKHLTNVDWVRSAVADGRI